MEKQGTIKSSKLDIIDSDSLRIRLEYPDKLRSCKIFEMRELETAIEREGS